MTQQQRTDISWLWTSGATMILLAVGGLLWQVKGLSEQMASLRDQGSPVLKARLDVMDSLSAGQQKQIEALTLELRSELRDIKLDIKEVRRILEIQTRNHKETP
jgi:hypothetical protein